jgi:hypothetical protein
MRPGRSMVRRRSHSCGVERAAADAACSPVALTWWADTWNGSPAASVQCMRSAQNQRERQCEVC